MSERNDGRLAEADPAVVRWHGVIDVKSEPALLKQPLKIFDQERILEYAARGDDRSDPVCMTQARRGIVRTPRHPSLKGAGDLLHVAPAASVANDRTKKGPVVQLIAFHGKVVRCDRR